MPTTMLGYCCSCLLCTDNTIIQCDCNIPRLLFHCCCLMVVDCCMRSSFQSAEVFAHLKMRSQLYRGDKQAVITVTTIPGNTTCCASKYLLTHSTMAPINSVGVIFQRYLQQHEGTCRSIVIQLMLQYEGGTGSTTPLSGYMETSNAA